MKLVSASVAAAMFVAAAPVLGQPVSRADFARASERVRALAEATRSVPGAAPAMAVIAVAEGVEPMIYVSGIADLRTGAKADADTPFYIASMTKAYMGLLAAELHHDGVLDLDSTLADHWPNLNIPGTDTNAITLRNLLTHNVLFNNSTLVFRTAFTDEIPAGDYPAILASHSQLRQPGFAYDNLGYLIYAAILEKETGKSWKDWLAQAVFSPLGLNRTSARTSAFPSTAAHQWDGANWRVSRTKPDSTMHAAGGLITSPRDMTRWLQAQVTGEADGIPSETFALAQSAISYPQDDRFDWSCDGYAFGWNRCNADGLAILEHGGGYTGFRSHMMTAPEGKVAFAVLSNSDSMTGSLATDLMTQFIKAITDPAASAPDPQAFAAEYASAIEGQLADREKMLAEDRADPQWQGWTWTPSRERLSRYAGRYRSERLGDIIVRLDEDGLTASLGELSFSFIPAAPDFFAGESDPLDTRAPMRFRRTDDGRIEQLLWGDRPFTRIE